MKLVNIEVERVVNQYTKQQLAQQLDVTVKTYTGYINGNPIPSSKLLLLSHLFGCSIDYMLGLSKAEVGQRCE